MQGKLAIAIVLAALGADVAICGETQRRQSCQKAQQAQQRLHPPQPQQSPQRKAQPQGCVISRPIPPVVDPTPVFLL